MLQGAVAQLGERLVCNQEATGSIPVSSTKIWEDVLSNEATHTIATDRGNSGTCCRPDSVLGCHPLVCQFVAGLL